MPEGIAYLLELAAVTAATVLVDRYISDKVAAVVLVVSLVLLGIIHWDKLVSIRQWAAGHRAYAILICVACGALLGLVAGLFIVHSPKVVIDASAPLAAKSPVYVAGQGTVTPPPPPALALSVSGAGMVTPPSKKPRNSPNAVTSVAPDIRIEAGKGGDANTPSGRGGDGGSINITAGSGGNASDKGNGGNGGNIVFDLSHTTPAAPTDPQSQLKLPMAKQVSDFEAAIKALSEQFPKQQYSTQDFFQGNHDGLLGDPSNYDIPEVISILQAKGQLKVVRNEGGIIFFVVTPQ